MIHVHSQDMIVEVHYVVISNSLTHRGIFSTIEEILYNCMKKEWCLSLYATDNTSVK